MTPGQPIPATGPSGTGPGIGPGSDAGQPVRRRRSSRWLDALSIYLPIVLMGALALGSYWLLRATPAPSEPVAQRQPSHEPDYFMRGFSVRTFDANGRLRTEVFGEESRHYPDTDTVEIDMARIRSHAEDGQLTTARADRITTNADQSEYLLRGSAQVVREPLRLPDGKVRPRLEFQGEFLHLLVNENRLESDRPVVLLRDRDRITADSLRYDDNTTVAHLDGRVRATLQPRR